MKQSDIEKQIILEGKIIQRKNKLGNIILEKLINLQKENKIEKSYVIENLIDRDFINDCILDNDIIEFGVNFTKRNFCY